MYIFQDFFYSQIKNSKILLDLKKEAGRIEERTKRNLLGAEQEAYLKRIKVFLNKIDGSENSSSSITFDWIARKETRGLIILTLLKEFELCKFLVHNLGFNVTSTETHPMILYHDERDDIQASGEYCWENHGSHYWKSGLMAAGYAGNIDYFRFLYKKFRSDLYIFNIKYQWQNWYDWMKTGPAAELTFYDKSSKERNYRANMHLMK